MSEHSLTEISSDRQEHFRKQAIIAESKITEKINKALDDTETAGRRWFWELLQNAKDTVAYNPNKPEQAFKNVKDKKVDVVLSYWQEGEASFLRFEHNGNPFRYSEDPYRFDDVTNLVLPVSGKDNEYQTGKFGTGFLSTHILSLKIDVDGVFLNKEGGLNDFNFVLDRTRFTADSRDSEGRKLFIESIVNALSNSVQYVPHRNIVRSSFTYHLNANIKNDIKWANQLVKEGLNDLEILLPFVLCFNNTIRTVTINNQPDGSNTRYELTDVKKMPPDDKPLFHYTVTKNGEPVDILLVDNGSLQLASHFKTSGGSDRKEMVNIERLYQQKTAKNIPFLFSSFPLIGSEEFKFPVIINSKNFKPKETRDSISLKNNESGNQTIINEAVQLYQKLLEGLTHESWKKTYNVCDTIAAVVPTPTHKWISDVWYKNQVSIPSRKSIVAEKLVDIPVRDEPDMSLRKAIHSNTDSVHFPGNNYKEAIWRFTKDLFPETVPALEEIAEWNKVLWENDTQIKKVNAEYLVTAISRYSNDITPLADKMFGQTPDAMDDLITWLYEFARFIQLELRQPALFDKKQQNHSFPILPNRKKQLKLLGELNYDMGFYDNERIEDRTLNLYADICGQDVTDWLIDKKFDALSLLPPKREIFEKDLAGKICETVNHKIREGRLSNSDKTTFSELRNYLYNIQKESVPDTDIAAKRRQDKYKKLYADLDLDKILISVVEPEKISSITRLLESDRDGTIDLKAFEQLAGRPDLLRIAEQILVQEEEDNFDFKAKKEIGSVFETLFDKIIEQFTFLERKKVDGEQDFLIRNTNTGNEFYIEIKSAAQNKAYVELTPDQGKAFANKNNYILCIVPDSNLVQGEESFLENAVFNNTLGDVLKTKVALMEDFEAANGGIEIHFETELLKKYKKYKYKYRIGRTRWGNHKFGDFLRWITVVEPGSE